MQLLYTELEILENFFSKHLTFSEKADDPLDFQGLVIRIKQKLIQSVFDLRKDRMIDFFIRNYYRRVVTLSNFLNGSENLMSSPPSFQNNAIDDLLLFIQITFPEYTAQELISDRLKIRSAKELKLRLKVIRKQYPANCSLLQLVLNPVDQFVKLGQPISFQLVNYYQTLTSQLLQVETHAKDEVVITESLKELLIDLNFNYLPFFRYVVEVIKNELESLDSITEKLGRLSWHLKWINQFQDIPESFNPKLKSITGMLSYWISEEMNFYENRLHIASRELKNSELKDFKLQTDLSVPQLAFLIRIFIKAGLFTNQHDREVLRFFAQFTRTKGAQIISPGNLVNKFYEQDGNVQDAVKGLVLKMLNQIQKLS